MNKLNQWLRNNGHNCKSMGRRVGITENSFRRYLSGHRLPSWEIMEKLERVTEGAITPNDFLPFARRRLKEARAKKKVEAPPEVEPIAAE